MLYSKALLFLFIFISICNGLPTSKNDSMINKEVKNSSEQDIKIKEKIEDTVNVKPPQINNPNLKVLNYTETKITTQPEEKSKSNQNDKTSSETVANSSDKDSQRTSLRSQNGSLVILGPSLKKSQDDETKTEKLPETIESSNKEKDKVEVSVTDNQETEKEKPRIKETVKESEENLKNDNNPKLSDDINQVEKEKQTNGNQSPAEIVTSEKQSTSKLNDKEVSKNDDVTKEMSKNEGVASEPLYNSDINLSEEKDKVKEETYDEYDDNNFQVNAKNNQEKENPSLNNPSGYIPNKNLGMIDDANSHFFAYLVTLMVLVVLFYLLFHNKQRIIALMIEGRGSRPSRRGSARAKYHKLDNNLEEAMGSMRSGGNANLNNIY
ncbi:Trans-Golgi network integral membrane protein TGN38 [Armadillidium nasatum]|uniref:Trans-Golgi network integral membrane protein TGN38 n=1 Tax=Armadillidium nasatum TaxID=96803 RepID=A0A5N5SIU3_9CRUS|nr:Trans-Golgi network integral membrane protein TGN38 [Armadillidium nasatum]KAB7495007.1 Trans-Golgi network integral membrane protein TGN38 [Armadillidium nasatum]